MKDGRKEASSPRGQPARAPRWPQVQSSGPEASVRKTGVRRWEKQRNQQSQAKDIGARALGLPAGCARAGPGLRGGQEHRNDAGLLSWASLEALLLQKNQFRRDFEHISRLSVYEKECV